LLVQSFPLYLAISVLYQLRMFVVNLRSTAVRTLIWTNSEIYQTVPSRLLHQLFYRLVYEICTTGWYRFIRALL